MREQRLRQYVDLFRRGEEITARAVVQRQRIRNLMFAEKTLRQQCECLVVLQQRGQAARPQTIANRKQSGDVFTVASQSAVPVGDYQVQDHNKEKRRRGGCVQDKETRKQLP